LFQAFHWAKKVEKQSTLLYNINYVMVFYLYACYLAAHFGDINFSLEYKDFVFSLRPEMTSCWHHSAEVIGRHYLTLKSLVNFTVLIVTDRSDRSQYVLEQHQYRLQATIAAEGLHVTCLRSRH